MDKFNCWNYDWYCEGRDCINCPLRPIMMKEGEKK